MTSPLHNYDLNAVPTEFKAREPAWAPDGNNSFLLCTNTFYNSKIPLSMEIQNMRAPGLQQKFPPRT